MGLFGPSKPAIEKKYKFGKVLGTGNFATVKLATRKNDNAEVAVKIIDKSKVDDMNDITVRAHTTLATCEGAHAQSFESCACICTHTHGMRRVAGPRGAVADGTLHAQARPHGRAPHTPARSHSHPTLRSARSTS